MCYYFYYTKSSPIGEPFAKHFLDELVVAGAVRTNFGDDEFAKNFF